MTDIICSSSSFQTRSEREMKGGEREGAGREVGEWEEIEIPDGEDSPHLI